MDKVRRPRTEKPRSKMARHVISQKLTKLLKEEESKSGQQATTR